MHPSPAIDRWRRRMLVLNIFSANVVTYFVTYRYAAYQLSAP